MIVSGERMSFFTFWDDETMVDKLTSGGEIFVVDDDPAVRDTLSMVLSAGREIFARGSSCFPM